MIIDDSVTLTGNPDISAATAVTTTDCIDRTAAGTCFNRFPTFVIYLKKSDSATADAAWGKGAKLAVSIMTCDEEGGTYEEVQTTYVPNEKMKALGAIAKIDMPIENMNRYIKFKLVPSAAPTDKIAWEVLVVPGAERDGR